MKWIRNVVYLFPSLMENEHIHGAVGRTLYAPLCSRSCVETSQKDSHRKA